MRREGGFRIDTQLDRERALRSAAISEGGALFAHHGDAAVAMLTARINDPATQSIERRRYRLARTEVERLARERRRGGTAQALVVWRAPLFSLAGFLALIGWRRNGRRRRR